MVSNHCTERPPPSAGGNMVDDVIAGLQSELSDGERKFIKYLLPVTKRAVNRREVGKVGERVGAGNSHISI